MATYAAPLPAAQLRERARLDRVFHTSAALAAALIVFVGFSPTFYLRDASQPPISWLVVVHGLVFSAWMVAYVLQTALIASRKRELHKTLGFVFTGLGAAMIVLGVKTALEAARRGAGGVQDMDPRTFMVIPFFDVVLFAGFLWAGYHWRKSAEAHKRLMLLATIDVIGPAIARMALHASSPVFNQNFPMWAYAGMMLFMAVACVYDVATRRRPHQAYIWGALVLTVSGPVRFTLGETSAWLSFVDTLLRWA